MKKVHLMSSTVARQNMRFKIFIGLVITILFNLSAHAGSTELPYSIIGEPSAPMGAAARFEPHPIGAVRTFVTKDGKEIASEVMEVNGSMVISRKHGDCMRKRSIDFLFYPQTAWWDCKKDKALRGENDITLKSGQVWPLEVGNRWKVKWKGGNQNKSWSNSAKCHVEREVRIKAHPGEYDAYEVICKYRSINKKNRFVRTRYYSPEINYLVASNITKNGKITGAIALSKIERPGAQ